MTDQTANITWRDGVPIATAFDDPYYSLENGLAETRHVFLGGNDLPARFGGDFHIGELGFGTGLNFLVTWAAWEAAGAKGTLTFTSFEAFPMSSQAMAQALAHFPEVERFASVLPALCKQRSDSIKMAPGVTLNLVIGDARETLPAWDGCADAWFLDGFSPAKNPELWEPDLIRAVGRHTAPQGTAATHSAAGHVRRALDEAGFDVARVAGFGRKRHMTVARMQNAE